MCYTLAAPMAEYVTKQDLTEFGEKLGQKIGQEMHTMAETIRHDFREELRETKSDIIGHFNASQAKQNERMDHMDQRMDRVEGKLDSIQTGVSALQEDMAKVKSAVLDLMATERYVRNLVRELKLQGINIDEMRVFAT